jgi:hypothetical protein
MTNTQAALIAAGAHLAGKDVPIATITAYAGEMTDWLDELDEQRLADS